MSLIQQIKEAVENDQLLEHMIVHMVTETIDAFSAKYKLDLINEVAGQRQGGVKVGDVVIQLVDGTMKPFVVTKVEDELAVARNPKDGDNLRFHPAFVGAGAYSKLAPVKKATQRLEMKYPEKQVWVHGDKTAKKDQATGQQSRKNIVATKPNYDDQGNIQFEPQPEFRGMGGVNRDARSPTAR